MKLYFWKKKGFGFYVAHGDDRLGPFDTKSEMKSFMINQKNITKPNFNQLFFVNGQIYIPLD